MEEMIPSIVEENNSISEEDAESDNPYLLQPRSQSMGPHQHSATGDALEVPSLARKNKENELLAY